MTTYKIRSYVLRFRLFFCSWAFLLTTSAVWAGVDDGLVGHWKFNEGTGFVLQDSIGENNQATIFNALASDWRAEGKQGKAFYFNGLNAHAKTATYAPFEYSGGALSVFCWFKPDSRDADGGYIISKPWDGRYGTYNYNLRYNPDRTLTLSVSIWGKKGSSLTTKTALTVDTWNHIGFVLTPAQGMKIFIDGSLVASGTYSLDANSSYDVMENKHLSLTFACIYPYGQGYQGVTKYVVQGSLDEIRSYNRALAESEPLQLFSMLQPFAIKPITGLSRPEGESIEIKLETWNPQNYSVRYEAINLPQGATFDSASKTFKWTPSYGQAGSYVIKFRMLYGSWVSEKDALITINKTVIPFSCKNSSTEKCIDLGASDEGRGLTFTPAAAFSEKETDGSINYRALKPKQTVDIDLPAFDVDSNGLPNIPLMLEVHYKDTFDKRTFNTANNRPYQGVFVYTRMDYINKDPLFSATYKQSSDKLRWQVLSLADNGDGLWKHAQFILQKSDFQLLRAIDGKFSIRVTMPAILLADEVERTVPIDYVSIRPITQDQVRAWQIEQRQALGFKEAILPGVEPQPQPDYPDPRLIVYTNDPMRPVFRHTKPQADEIDQPIRLLSARGEIEPAALNLYSEIGISNISVRASDLVLDSTHKIPALAISVEKVVEWDSWLNPHGTGSRTYASVPDRLEPLNTISIGPGQSQRLWVKTNVPQNISGGTYRGAVEVLQGSAVLKSIPISLEVIPVTLDISDTLNMLYHDPYQKTLSSDQNEVFKFYRETQYDQFIHSVPFGASLDSKGNLISDTTLFEQRLDRMKAEGLIRKIVFLELGGVWPSVYTAVYKQSSSAAGFQLYDQLNKTEFRSAFSKVIQHFQAIAGSRGFTFVFSVTDEPGSDPYKRIICDRLYTIIKENNCMTTVTYYTGCEAEISSGDYQTPTGKIPPLTNLVDYKVWTPYHEDQGYDKQYNIFGYYTTYFSNPRNPIYNRFLHGLLAVRTNAKVVSNYAVGDTVADPFNDFDPAPRYIAPFTYPDFIMGYPTWSGKFYPTLANEGVREGIKDSKYIATLRRLISRHPGPIATEAQQFLDSVLSRISPYLIADYSKKALDYGFYPEIVKRVSDFNSSDDFEIFSGIRWTIARYVEMLSALEVVVGDLSNDGKVTAYDAALAVNFTGTPTVDELKRGDVNKDGKIGAADAVLISKKAVGLS